MPWLLAIASRAMRARDAVLGCFEARRASRLSMAPSCTSRCSVSESAAAMLPKAAAASPAVSWAAALLAVTVEECGEEVFVGAV